MPETIFPTVPPQGDTVKLEGITGQIVQVRQIEGTIDFLGNAPILRATSEGGEEKYLRVGETYHYQNRFNELQLTAPPNCPVSGSRLALEVYEPYEITAELQPGEVQITPAVLSVDQSQKTVTLSPSITNVLPQVESVLDNGEANGRVTGLQVECDASAGNGDVELVWRLQIEDEDQNVTTETSAVETLTATSGNVERFGPSNSEIIDATIGRGVFSMQNLEWVFMSNTAIPSNSEITMQWSWVTSDPGRMPPSIF